MARFRGNDEEAGGFASVGCSIAVAAKANCGDQSEGRNSMKNGFRVFDADTHVNPAAEVLERYVDPGFRPRLAELAQYRSPVSREADGLHNYRVAPNITGGSSVRRSRARPSAAANPSGAAARRRGPGCRTTGRKPRQGHGRRGDRRSFPDPRLVDEPSGPARPLVRSRDDPRLSPSHGGFLRAVPGPAERLDRRLRAQRRGGGA